MSFKDLVVGMLVFAVIVVIVLIADAPELFGGLDDFYRTLPHWAVIVPFAVVFVVLLGAFLYVTYKIQKLREDVETEID